MIRRLVLLLPFLALLAMAAMAQLPAPVALSVTVNTNGVVIAPAAFWAANSNLMSAASPPARGAVTNIAWNAGHFAVSGTNVSLASTVVITNDLIIDADLTRDVEFRDIARLTLDATDSSLGGVATTYVDGGITTVRGITNLNLITPAVHLGTAATNQVLHLTDAVDGAVEFRAVNDTTKLPIAGGTMTGALNMGSQRITSLSAPAAASDATTRQYVDDRFFSAGSLATNMVRWRAKRLQDALTAGGRNPRIVCIGDSTVRGINTTEQATRTNMHLFSWPYWLARQLQSNGIPATADSIWGVGGSSFSSSPPITSLDSRITRSGTGITTAESSLGGQSFSGTAAGSITFTPLGRFDTVRLHWIRNSGLGTFSYSINGGTATNVATAGSAAMQNTTVYCGSVSNHTVTVAWVSGTWYLRGITCTDSTSVPYQIEVYNMGISGGVSANMSGGTLPWGPAPMLTNYLNPDLVIIEGGVINDWRTSVSFATSMTNIAQIISDARSVASVVVLTPPFDSGGAGLTAQQNTYVQGMIDLADAYGVGVLNWRLSIGSQAIALAAGLLDDSVHTTSAGNADIALAILKLVR
jgi:hypothetical protein